MRKFFLWLLITTLVVCGSTLLGRHYDYFSFPSFFYPTLVLLLFSTGLIFAYLYKASKPTYFVQLYLLTMVVKILAYLAFNLVMIVKDKPGAVVNVVFFMIVYFIFTALEIGFLFHKISRHDRS